MEYLCALLEVIAPNVERHRVLSPPKTRGVASPIHAIRTTKAAKKNASVREMEVTARFKMSFVGLTLSQEGHYIRGHPDSSADNGGDKVDWRLFIAAEGQQDDHCSL